MRLAARRFANDRRGVSATEFAIVFPVMMILMLGLGDLAYEAYVQSVLTGTVQKVGRDSTIQGNANNSDTLDLKITNVLKGLAPGATFVSSRQNYDTYKQAGPEPYTDSNGNGQRDAGECYDDLNNNGTWDNQPAGATGQGGASDITLYRMTMVYPRLFPVASMIGWTANVTISASTILRNQPYATQTISTVAWTNKCTP